MLQTRGVRWAATAVVLTISVLAAPMAGADAGRQVRPPAAEVCVWPDPCDYRWEGGDLGPFELAQVEEVVVKSHDGTPLRGWLAFPDLPEGLERAPVALHSSPYIAQCLPQAGECPDDPAYWTDAAPRWAVRPWGVAPIELVRHGYVTALFELRGTGASGGCFDWGGTDEQRDQAALVEWLAAQGWSSGRVGMGGNSYPAVTAWEAAVEAPEGLATIVTAGIISDWYTAQHSPQGALYDRTGVIVNTPFELTGTAWPAHAGEAPLDGLSRSSERPAECAPFPMTTGPAANGLRSERDPAVWEPRRYIERFDQVRASVLVAQGLQDNDLHAFQDMRVWAALPQVHLWQISGQWMHGPPFHNPERALTPEWIDDNWRTILFGWLGYWLQGVGERPPERVDYQDTTGAWHRAGAWPPPQARAEALHLDGDRLTDAPGDSDRRFRVAGSPGNDHASASAQDVPVPAGAWAWCRQDAVSPADADTAVAYISEPLATERLLAGNPHAELTLTADQPGGVVQVSLLRWPAGTSCAELADVGELVANGAADLRYHLDRYTAQPFPLDTPTPVRVDLFNTAVRFAPGDRLIAVVSGPEGVGLYGSTSPYAPEVTVHADASRVVLPFVPGGVGAPTGGHR